MQTKQVAFIGTGVSHNDLIALFLRKGIRVTICDRKTEEQMGETYTKFKELGAEFDLGDGYLEHLTNYDVVFRTPGMYFNNPALTAARKQGVIITSEMETFFDLCPCRIYGVTGSDGKTTTTTLISEMLAKTGRRVYKGGNIGKALLPLIETIREEDAAVVELSSFQLISMRRSPDVAVITNISPNHLDVHGTMEEYIGCKVNLIAHQNAYSKTVLNLDNAQTAALAEQVRGRLLWFTRQQKPERGTFLDAEGWAEFTLNGKTRRKMQLDAVPLDRNYPNFVGIRSAITGEKIKVLGPHDAIINEKQAKQIFGDKNPVGASIRLSKDYGNYQLRLVDVYQDLSLTEQNMSSSALFYSPWELEDMDSDQFYAGNLYVVLKEGCTPQQLKAEVNSRLKPLGLKVKTEKLKDRLSEEYSTVAIACSITYLIGSLILLAAIIGFLRMQTQLFWMRRREISLRITNGATRLQLFSMFATEVVVIVLGAYFVAVLMGSWICDYLARPQFAEITSELGTISHLYLYSLVIGLVVMMLCLAIIWIVLSRICKRTQALESGMRRSHNHWFRNTMLGVQVMISMFFLGVTFCLLCWVGKMAEFNHIPDDERAYEQSLFLQTNAAENGQRLRDKLIHLPQVERWMPYSWGFWKEK